MKTNYYIIAVNEDGDVLAIPATLVDRAGLDISVKSVNDKSKPLSQRAGFENQGDSDGDKFDAARDALASVMPNSDDDDVDPAEWAERGLRNHDDNNL